jgi:hypothetical protein
MLVPFLTFFDHFSLSASCEFYPCVNVKDFRIVQLLNGAQKLIDLFLTTTKKSRHVKTSFKIAVLHLFEKK